MVELHCQLTFSLGYLTHVVTMRLHLLIFSVLVTLAISEAFERSARADPKPLDWWQQSVVYQIYPRSFQDSDGDGVGDLNGITSRLDYLQELGIDAVWISPIYKSPMKDFGYDIADFEDIDPIFGTLDDWKNMAAEFKKRGMKIIMDMVPNHSSDLHKWFNASVNRVEPYTDYYVWKDPKGFDENGKPIVPNNWVSTFSGPAWEWNEQRQQFYLHQFDKSQPDFNYENIKVRNSVLAIFKYWLDLGVDGFRVDAVPWLYEDQQFRDQEPDPDRDPALKPDEWNYWNRSLTYDLPAVKDFLADMRQLLDVYTAADGRVRVVMVEANVTDASIPSYYGTPEKPVAHFPFNFKLIGVQPTMNASEVLSLVKVWYDILPDGFWPTILLGNHDQRRVPTRWTAGTIDGANMINLLVQGTAITYNGEEIGMSDTYLTWEETVDPAACNTDPERYEKYTRDPERTPMQWSNGTGAGFTTSDKPWLPLNPDYPQVNVDAQEAADQSHLKVYKALLKLRQTSAWRYGSFNIRSLYQDRVLGFTRVPSKEIGGEGLLVLVNLSDSPVSVDSSYFSYVPVNGTVAVLSVGFQSSSVVSGGQINTRTIPLGARDSIVVQFTPLY